jgi:enoyl-CoA hydratase
MAVDFEVRGRAGLMTIARPEARNAVNGEVARGLEAAIDRIEADPEIWVGVLTGVPPVFCAGADLRAISEGRNADLYTDRGGFAGMVLRDRRKPLIAAIEGPALAGGCELALACDLIVAGRQASFGIPEVRRSLIAAAGGLVRLPQALPRNIAMQMALTGLPISAELAHVHGMVNVLTEPGQALAGALDLAGQVCEGAPLAVQGSRAVVLATLGSGPEAGWTLSHQTLEDLAGTGDYQEGPRAFLAKRQPVWTGR